MRPGKTQTKLRSPSSLISVFTEKALGSWLAYYGWQGLWQDPSICWAARTPHPAPRKPSLSGRFNLKLTLAQPRDVAVAQPPLPTQTVSLTNKSAISNWVWSQNSHIRETFWLVSYRGYHPGGGGTHMWKWYICATEGLKIGGLGSGPLLKMRGGAFRTGPHVKKGGWELKLTKKHIFLWKEGSFRAAQVEKVEALGALGFQCILGMQ